jgi:hypothetical protein
VTADPIQVIADLFAGDGARDYLGEPVTQASHMLRRRRWRRRPARPRRSSRLPCCTTSATSPR